MTQASCIRVCIVAPSADLIGGQARQAQSLLAGLNREEGLRAVFIPHNPKLPVGVKWLQSIKYVRTVVTTLAYWGSLLSQLGRCEVVHVFSASYYSYMLSVAPAILVGKLYGKKVVLNYRSGEAEDHLKHWPLTTVPVMKLADAIVAPSGYLVDVFKRFGLPAQSIVNVVELDRFSYRQRSPLRPVFLTSRALEPLYNVACVLRAFRRIQDTFPAATLMVAGEGSERQMLSNLGRQLKLRNVEFLGNVAPENMPTLYDKADIYLMAPNLDNMPGTILECYAAGLPVVTTAAGGIPYILTHEQTGLLSRCNDAEGLADQAVRLLNDPVLAAGVVRRAHEASRQYSWPCVQTQWRNLYQYLVPQAHRGRVLNA